MKRMMIIPLIMALIWLAVGCTRVKNLANINIDIPYVTTVTIPEIRVDTPVVRASAVVNIPAIAVATNYRQYMDQYHTSEANVRQVDLKSLGLQIKEPPTGNFDFVDSVQVYLSAVGRGEVLLAYQYNVSVGKNTLDLIASPGVDLKPYFLSDTMYVRMRTVINSIPEQNTQLEVKTVFHMVANPLY